MPDPYLPAEMLDHVVDHLRDTKDALRNCSLVAKSWVPRTRKHLFADIEFPTAKSIQSWKEAFPDPSTSPARYTKTLFVDCPKVDTAPEAEMGCWINGFSRVEHLEVRIRTMDSAFQESVAALAPFHGFSLTLKSLRVVVPPLPTSHLFSLILSFPLLEDLAVTVQERSANNDDGSGEGKMPNIARPLSPSMFTGSLDLYLRGGMTPFVRRLLSIPGSVRFRELIVTWFCEEDFLSIVALVGECSHNLESLRITGERLGCAFDICIHSRNLHLFPGGSGTVPIGLSTATKLKDVEFVLNSWNVRWVITPLQTITPEHGGLRQITVHIPFYLIFSANITLAVGEANYGEWLDLDRLLVQLWESHSIRPKVVIMMTQGTRDFVGRLLPETTKGEIINLVDLKIY
jgi:hypothetical protein